MSREGFERRADLVRMHDAKGPHDIHPNGEVGAAMPLDGEPRFDGFPQCWYVGSLGTDHRPTVTGGDADVLYLLPVGAIELMGRGRHAAPTLRAGRKNG